MDDEKKRIEKLEEIRALGIDPYPHTYCPTHEVETILQQYEGAAVGSFEEAEAKTTDFASLAGRIVLHRSMGKNIFAQIQEGSSRVQVLFNRDHTCVRGFSGTEELSPHKFLEKKLDLGDIIGVEGHLFRTHKGELTLYATEVTLLCKSLLPLPDKHSGLVDKEARYRNRWVDLIANPEVMRTFKLRSRIVQEIRAYFAKENFMEVETPILERIYGGAQAKPFTTHLNALHMDMFLRIALEISLKKLIVGGLSRVYEIGKLFRNEGIDATHNPEFTSVECYATYWDYHDVMRFTESLYEHLALTLFGTTKIGLRKDKKGNEHEIDLKAPWKRMSMVESLKHYAGIEVDDIVAMRRRLEGKFEVAELAKMSHGILVAKLFEEYVEEHLIQPHFITDHPIETTPLCKLHRDPELAKQGIVERFEGFILGSEICNAYTELNDPILQRKLLEEQDRLLKAGDSEANPIDEEFLEAIAQGMPPCGGLGIGIDRLIMLFTGESSIRDVLYFPLMKTQTTVRT